MSWPTLVLIGGIVLSLAANLAQADPTVWGWLTAATPAGAFLVAVSMLERRSSPRPEDVSETSPDPIRTSGSGSSESLSVLSRPQLVPARDGGPAPALVDYARRVADEHHAKHGRTITRDALRARLGVSEPLASDLFNALRITADTR